MTEVLFFFVSACMCINVFQHTFCSPFTAAHCSSSPDILSYRTAAAHCKHAERFQSIFPTKIVLEDFLPRCMECRRGLAMRKLSVRQTREL